MFTAGVFVGFVLGIGFTIAAWEVQMGRAPWPAKFV